MIAILRGASNGGFEARCIDIRCGPLNGLSREHNAILRTLHTASK